jgi:hypothetical protein
VLVTFVLFALGIAGCGGASAAKSGGMPGAPPPDRDADGVMDAPDAPPREESVYATAGAAPAAPSDARMAQAPPPAPPAQAGAPGPEKKAPDVPQPTPTGETPAGAGAGGEKTIAGPLLIYTATVHLAVFETKKSMDAAEKLARESGGYLVRRDDRTITFRVPSNKFQGTFDEVLKLGDVLHRDVNVRDVTEEFFDLQIRVRNLEAMRDRLEDLLKRAQKVEEALAVERELERVAGEIERLKGRLKLLKELIAFSTITIQFQPRATDHVDSSVTLPFPWLSGLGLADLLRL